MAQQEDLMIGTGRRFHTPTPAEPQQYFNAHNATGLGITSSASGDDYQAPADCDEEITALEAALIECSNEKIDLEEENIILQEELDNFVTDNGGTFVFQHTKTTGTGICEGAFTGIVIAYYEGNNKWTIDTTQRPACSCGSYSIRFIRPNGTTAFNSDGHPSPSTGNSATDVGVWTVNGIYNCDGQEISTLGTFIVRSIDGVKTTSLSVNEYLNTVDVTY